MKEFRKDKNCTEHYTSLEELRKGFGLKPVIKRTKDAEKLQSQREKFLGTCRVCKKTLSIVSGTNILCCQNPECKGLKMTGKSKDGLDKEWYIPVTRVLDERGAEIARNLFD